jgi:hypothetical protein
LGSISGKIELQGTDDPKTVFILFMGSNTFTRPTDLAGNFTATSMAKGKYAVTLITTLDDYAVMDTSFVITAGRDSVIPQPIVMNYTGIPVPKGLRIEYDTMKQIVTLYWNTPTTGRPLMGYNIYRKHQDSALVLLRADWTDTVYHDSTGMQDITYDYRVSAIDTNTMEGTRSASVSVTVSPAFSITDTLFTIGGYGWIYAVERDAYDNYVVVNGTAYYPTPAKIERYTAAGALINSWDIPGGVEESYGFNCIALGDSNTIFVVTKDNKVIRYDTAGGLLSQFQYPGTARGIGLLRDTLYIGDRAAHIVRAYNSAGDSLFAWGSNGNGNGQFVSIVTIRSDTSQNNILVEDLDNYPARIQLFDRNGNFISFFTLGTSFDFGELDVRNDTILVCSGWGIGSFTTNGSLIFRYRTWNPSSLGFIIALFDNFTNDPILFKRTGEVIRLTRK